MVTSDAFMRIGDVVFYDARSDGDDALSDDELSDAHRDDDRD